MNPWLESILCVVGSLLLICLAWRTPRLRFLWFGAGLAGIAVALWQGPVLYHRTSGVMMTLAVPPLTMCFSGWMEFLAPAISRWELSHLATQISTDGVCIQTTEYTCGPAAAVTLLRRHGFRADEGDLAIRSKASFHTGVDAPLLAAAVEEEFRAAGVKADSARDQTIEQLQQAGECLAVVPFDADTDHWVAVLEVTNENVIVADPLRGMRTMSRAEFAETWRHEIVRIHFPAKAR